MAIVRDYTRQLALAMARANQTNEPSDVPPQWGWSDQIGLRPWTSGGTANSETGTATVR